MSRCARTRVAAARLRPADPAVPAPRRSPLPAPRARSAKRTRSVAPGSERSNGRVAGMEPIDRATVWSYDERGEPGPFVYSRYAHPTGAAAERALAEIEGAPAGQALLFASGAAAAT